MEIVKKTLHMCCPCAQAAIQFALEEDANLPDYKKDAESVCLENGEVEILEVKPESGVVTVKGQLVYKGLYHTGEEGCPLSTLTGKIPFAEKIHMDCVDANSSVNVEGWAEDLTISLINSRKWNLKALVCLTAVAETSTDDELPVGVHEAPEKKNALQYRMRPMETTRITVCKNDIFRMKEEASLPSGYPNISCVLWEKVCLQDMEFRAMNDRIDVTGDAALFVLYEGEGENHPVQSYETVFPINGSIECKGCSEGTVVDVKYCTGQKEVSVRPDMDGEERCLGLDLVLNLQIRGYAEEKQDVLDDLYSTQEEAEVMRKAGNLSALVGRFEGKMRLADSVKIDGTNLFQLLHSECMILPDDTVLTNGAVTFSGSIKVKLLYITGEDEHPYVSQEKLLPYEYTMDATGADAGDFCAARTYSERLLVTMNGSEEAELKVMLGFYAVIFHKTDEMFIDQAQMKQISSEERKHKPGVVIYTTREKEGLWNIGKKYKVSVDNLKALNGLTTDVPEKGSKILILKE